MYINTPDRELTHPIRPSTEDGKEFKTTRQYGKYLSDNGLVERTQRGGTTQGRTYRYNKATGKVEEVV